MRYGMSLRSSTRELSGYTDRIEVYENAGLDSVWCAQLFGVDALTLFAIAGARTSRIRMGTAVIPTYSRHPLVLASQALTVQAATGNRLLLGIGSSHRALVADVLGADYDRPAAYLREYLTVLPPLLRGERVDFDGERLHADSTSRFGRAGGIGSDAPPVYVGTMFPISLRIAGRLADGIVTWLVGTRTLADLAIPTLLGAAEEADRPRPRVVASIPIAVCATAEIGAHREAVDRQLETFVSLPVYQQVLEREGASQPSDLAAIGDEQAVAHHLARFAEIGVDEIFGVCFGNDATLHRTAEFLGRLADDRGPASLRGD
jgi:F420-dependent oxidoreductase-like protein